MAGTTVVNPSLIKFTVGPGICIWLSTDDVGAPVHGGGGVQFNPVTVIEYEGVGAAFAFTATSTIV